MATIESPTRLLTAEDLLEMPDDGRNYELVRGKLVLMNPPKPPHGFVSGNIAFIVTGFVRAHGLGNVLINDSGVVTRRRPDTVRGADIAYYSRSAIPDVLALRGYAAVPPELVFEVRSPSDRWSEITEKVSEYLTVGVKAVCVVNPNNRSVQLFTDESDPRRLEADDTLEFPEILPGFSVTVGRFFE